MLGDLSEGGLGKLKEVDDDNDDDENIDPIQPAPPFFQSIEAKTIEKLERENAMLRQQQQQYQNAAAAAARAGPRPRTSSAYGASGPATAFRPEEPSDYAIDELDETFDTVDAMSKKQPMGRRLSEYTIPTAYRSGFPTEPRKNDSLKQRAFWQSSLGFGGLGDIPQSRRHSFANVPTRQPSITSMTEAQATALEQAMIPETKSVQDFGYPYENSNNNGVSYFSGNPSLVTSPQQPMQHSGFPNPYPTPYSMHSFSGRTASPNHNAFPISQPRHNQLLHIVLFKCARADVFYIQDGTGLAVKPGDLVIVEADRGTDLGTVAKIGVDWQTAKELKEHYAEEQYKWLMMYSQNAKAAQDNPISITGGPGMAQPGAIGGMGPPGQQHHMQEPVSNELKPKLIKRLAQNHEISALREKEGNEAKAKRICMQKVKEHGLNMEILDAEFQMDWKKLTLQVVLGRVLWAQGEAALPALIAVNPLSSIAIYRPNSKGNTLCSMLPLSICLRVNNSNNTIKP
ncbi:putative protein PB7E8.02 [Ceratocystis platani]|uniref:PSP1 C-terminal domain-containing protein n=1 Tax=Ceratocystis fimbriata f. sp. platani TaxID=88771 RepID=A0A0F8BXN6_CERFI|nr:putative protein PB7E8.02 [Ceratocystis platani]